MESPADRVDRLLALADEALDREDVDQAIAFVREAHTLAPLRKDIKEELSKLLMMSAPVDDAPPVPARGRKAAPKMRERAVAAAEPEEYEEEPPDGDEASQSVSLGSTRSFGLAEFMRTGPDAPPVAARPAPRKRPRAAAAQAEDAGSISDILSRDFGFPSDDEADEFCTAADTAARARQKGQRRGEPEPVAAAYAAQSPFFEDAPPAAAPPRPRPRAAKAPKRAAAEDEMDMDFGGAPAPRAAQSGPSPARRLVRRLSGASPRFVASAAVYGFIVVFVGTASIFSYVKFQSGGAQTATRIIETIAEPKPVSPPPRDVAVPATPATRTQEEIIRLAQEYLKKERWDDAVALLTPVAQSAEKSATRDKITEMLGQAHDGKATAQLVDGKLGDAVETFRKAVEFAPGKTDFRLHLANALYHQATAGRAKSDPEKLREALGEATKCLDMDRSNLAAYEMQGTLYESLRQNTQAVATWNRVIKVAPESSTAQLARERLKALSKSK